MSPQEAAELLDILKEHHSIIPATHEAMSLAVAALEREAKAEPDQPASQVRDIPEGWVMVPREPDAGLVLIGMNAFDEVCGSGQPMDLAVAHAWRTMLGLCERRDHPAPETT